MYIIGGKYKRHKLNSPKGFQTRPTLSQVREALFNICQTHVESSRFLDLFAGSGAIGLEALSRGADFVTFVDLATGVIQKNVASLREQAHTDVIRGDVLVALRRLMKLGATFDLIYADPPYGLGHAQKVLSFIDTHPLLTEEGWLMIEDTPFIEPPLKALECFREKKIGSASLRFYTRSKKG